MNLYDALKDRWPGSAYSTQPARLAFAVVPSDTDDIAPKYGKALYVGVSGNITLVPAGDVSDSPTPVLFINVPVGTLPVQVRRVLASGTTAGGIVALTD